MIYNVLQSEVWRCDA